MAHAPRSRPVARVPIAAAKMELAVEQVERLVALHRSNALVDLPSLTSLRASRLCVGLVVEDNQLFVQLSIEESSQLVLDLDPASTEDPRPDPFAADLARVAADRDSVEARLLLALSHGAGPAPGAGSNPHEPSLQSLRLRVRRGLEPDGSVSCAGWPVGARIQVGEVPRHLPNGPVVKIRAGVQGLRRDWVTLERIDVEPGSSLTERQWHALSRRRRIRAYRQGMSLQGPEAASRLATAMELRETLHVEAVAALDWSTGQTSGLALLSMSDGTTWQASLQFSDAPGAYARDDCAGSRPSEKAPQSGQVMARD